MLRHAALSTAFLFASLAGPCAQAQEVPQFDEALAKSLGADQRGMRSYVFVLLKTGPNKMAAGPERDAMFQGHFANITRLAKEKKLVVAGPYDGLEGWRGMFIFAVADIEEAKQLVATDPVIRSGEMVAEYHKLYSTAGLMMINEIHGKLSKP
ncbi:MAG: YciI family protein [Burkholderiaceae bacterium]|nr:YciI family protein [Burkholderiaceae bacterium]